MAIAVILAAGNSSRIHETLHMIEDPETRRIAETSQKGMIPINKRPFIDYQLENLRKAKYRDVCFVINRETGDRIRYVYGNQFKDAINIEYAYQDKPLGQAHAMLCAEGVVGDSPFVALNSDNLYSPRTLSRLLEIPKGEWGTTAFDVEGLLRGKSKEEMMEKLRNWSVLEVSSQDQELTEDSVLYVKERHEKPQKPEAFSYNGRILVDMTCGFYTSDFFRIAEELHERYKRSVQEGDMPDEMRSADVQNMAIEAWIPIRALYADEWVPDLTTCADIPVLEERLRRFKWFLPHSAYTKQE
jgi:NDP-sugar pyrophosphorylase family protein